MNIATELFTPATTRALAARGLSKARLTLAHSGLLGVPVGCLIGVAMIPETSSVDGALMLSAWFLAAGLVTGMVAGVIMNGMREVFRAEHVLLVGVIIVVFPELLQPSYVSELPVEIVRKTFLAGLWNQLRARQLFAPGAAASNSGRSGAAQLLGQDGLQDVFSVLGSGDVQLLGRK